MSSCIIYLDNYSGQYYPGSVVTGRVICSFNNEKTVRGIRLKLSGKEHTEWTKTESYYDNEAKESKTRTVHCSGNNRFFFTENTLLGSGNVPRGRHEYQFSFSLPKNLPGTYHGKYGSVRYMIKATVDRPYKIDYEDEKEVNVASLIDFNEIRNELQLDPVAYSDDKVLCCCCCASDPITIAVHLEKEAFVQGETAKVKVEITNMSNESIEELQLKLTMTVTSKVTHPSSDSKTDKELLATASNTGVGAHGERTYFFDLEIPRSAAIPNFKLCTLFEQHSVLKVTAVLPGCHSDMEIYAGVVMGHIPIGGSVVRYQNGDLQVGSPISPPFQDDQYPGGMPYAPTATPYPPNAPYPNGSQPPSYPSVVSPSQIFPNPAPPMGGIGFQTPQSNNAPPAEFPPLPTGTQSHNPLPYPPGPMSAAYPPPQGPSAPPMDGGSAPTKAQMAEGGFEVVGTGASVLDGSGGPALPPSYNEAVPYPPK